MGYLFRNSDGKVCCSANDPKNLCPRCQQRWRVSRPTMPPVERKSPAEWTAHYSRLMGVDLSRLDDTVSPPPSLRDAIVRHRERPSEVDYSGLGVPRVNATSDAPDPPPDLRAAIMSRRAATEVRR